MLILFGISEVYFRSNLDYRLYVTLKRVCLLFYMLQCDMFRPVYMAIFMQLVQIYKGDTKACNATYLK